MDSLNRLAIELVDEAIDFADELTIAVESLSGDAAVLDFGVEVPGGIEAGLLSAEIGTAGLSTVATSGRTVAGAPLTHVELATDHPALALLCAGKGGWELSVGDFEGLGSGPARALVAEEEIFQQLGYRETADFAVLCVETDQLPGEDVAAAVAQRTGVAETAVFLPAYRSASLTGAVVAASRAAELATFRLAELGYDPAEILSASGIAPVPPVPGTEDVAMARAADAVAYGGRVQLTVDEPFDRFEAVASTAATEVGGPLAEAFADVGWEFAALPREVFGPAQVTVDVVGGDTHVVGATHEEILAESFGL